MPSEVSQLSFAGFALSWLATWASVRLKASGYTEYESVARVHLIPAFGETPLSEVTTQAIQFYIADKITAGLAPRSVKNHIIVLKRILGTAVDYGLLHENPVDKAAMPRIERTEMSFLTAEQIRKLIQNTPTAWKLLIAFPVLIGLRVGELRALEWSDISTEAMTVSITKSMRGGVVSSPKTSSSVATVPMPESLSPYLAQRRRLAGDHRLVFCKADGSPLADTTPGRVLSRALAAADLPKIRFHDLRRSWCIGHLQAGTDLRTLMALGRWSSPTTLLQSYSVFIPATGGDAVRRLDQLVNDQE